MSQSLQPPLSSTQFGDLDRAIAELNRSKQTWVQLKISQRLDYLQRCLDGVMSVADAWVAAACDAKGIDPQSNLAGEEWILGPFATAMNLRLLIKTLQAGGQPSPVSVSRRSSGQTVAQVFPDDWMDRLLCWGYRGDLWIEPDQPATQGLVYRQKSTIGSVALVLGAGNVSSISPMDTLYKLVAEDQVVILKMNPVNDYMGQFLEQALNPLIADGFLRIVYGGAEVGRYLSYHPDIATIHVTGSHRTHDAIVWGDTAEEQARRKAEQRPILSKPITSELGCVTPVLVVPGKWSQADIRFQARHVASMVAHNASFNCVAAKVIVTAKGWQQREEFLHQLQVELAQIPPRQAYYPGAEQRYQAFRDRYPQAISVGSGEPPSSPYLPWMLIPDVPARAGEYALSEEAFCGLLAEVSLPVSDASTFLTQAVNFVNEAVWGNLSCVVLIDPATQRSWSKELEWAIANLRYGVIGVNVWTGAAYSLAALTWGAFSGNPLADIQSGQGVVHNTYLFEHPQKSVLQAPFRIRPTPLWFAGHKNLLQLAQRLTALQANPSLSKLMTVILAALKG